MVTGEERIRELLGQLYGAVAGYDGKPTAYQATRADSLAHELEDVIGDFQKLTARELPAINSGMKKKKLEAISVLTEADWQKKRDENSAPSSSSPQMRAVKEEIRERD
jgi:hypothetical protein